MQLSFNTERIFNIRSESEFSDTALKIFHFQAETIPVYRDFIRYLGLDHDSIDTISRIPFLPVEFFRFHEIIVPGIEPEMIFESSRTTGDLPSKHLIADISLYEKSIRECFQVFYGKPENYCFLALLPSYLERRGSSLVHMAEYLTGLSDDTDSGFYMDNNDKLIRILEKKNKAGTPSILLGLSFALADLAEKYQVSLPHIIFMETGGMKGRRKEIIREELHSMIRKSFGVHNIHSEYGMTELLSQAYSKLEGKFYNPPWMKILVRDLHDPRKILEPTETGILNIIDLANLNSCAFLATSDLGRLHYDGSFEVLGRTDHSDIRGCNLMVADD